MPVVPVAAIIQTIEGGLLQRLFSMFPNGWPGRGLLLLRASVGGLLVYQSLSQSPGMTRFFSIAFVASVVAGLLFLLGIWTPVAGLLLAASEILKLCSGTNQSEAAVLVAAIAVSIAMLGPGVWSIDAVLFGRHRLELPED